MSRKVRGAYLARAVPGKRIRAVTTAASPPGNVVRNWLIARERVARGEQVEYAEGGNSMLPLIKSGQPVTLSPVDPALLEKGDIVLVKVGRNVYTHKVTGVRPGQVEISNNRGHVNGWASLASVFAIVSAIDGVPVRSAQPKVKQIT